jgi:hypothetical protein
LNNLIYFHKLDDIARFNRVNHIPAILSRMSLAEANRVNHIPAILSRILLAEANRVNHISAILSRMPLAEANRVNTLDFIYIEHNIYYNCIHQKDSKLYKCK